MKVIAFDPAMTSDKAQALGIEQVTLDELFERADFITMHVPLVAGTKHLLNDAAFARMKKGVLIVNAARGGIIDEDALVRAIDDGTVRGVALDVFETEPPAKDHPLTVWVWLAFVVLGGNYQGLIGTSNMQSHARDNGSNDKEHQ